MHIKHLLEAEVLKCCVKKIRPKVCLDKDVVFWYERVCFHKNFTKTYIKIYSQR